MGTPRNVVIFITGLVVCLLVGISVYLLSPAKRSVTGATDGPNVATPPPGLSVPSIAGLASQSADTIHPPQPQVSSGSPPVYKYNAQGQLAAIIYADGSVCTYRYDAHGNKISETRQSGQTWTYLYDKSDKPVATIDPKGDVTRENGSSNTAQ
jgi:YD repeat-containing protein